VSAALFVFNDADDRVLASDGVSRYGAYLRQNAHLFEGWDGQVTRESSEFAAAAWEVATSPIMGPPYLDWSAERVRSITFSYSEHDTSLLVRVEVATPRPAVLGRLRGFSDWDRGDRWNRGYHVPPNRHLSQGPALLTSAVVVFPIPTRRLFFPQDAPGALTVKDAKQSVKQLALELDDLLAPVLAALDTTH
jgi:hypothetical protein